MKYLVVVPDGAAGYPLEELKGKTSLEAAKMPFINDLAKKSRIGMVNTIPEGIPPGSDVANLSVMGYDPKIYLKGRSSLEAISLGVELKNDDITFRVNLVSLEGEGKYEDLKIIDHSSSDISSEEGKVLIEKIQEEFGNEKLSFYPGISYRNLLVVHNQDNINGKFTPPHDILDKKIGSYLPENFSSDLPFRNLMEKSYNILKDNEINLNRIKKGLNPANSIWIWGMGKKTILPSFAEKFGIKGSVISAVDLVKGIGLAAGLNVPFVQGATGGIVTDYSAKEKAAEKEFENGSDFVYVHIEAPDESSHQGDIKAKLEALSNIDQKIIKPLFEFLEKKDDNFRILVVPDHRTPIKLRTHSSDSVPFVFYNKEANYKNNENAFNENKAKNNEKFSSGVSLFEEFMKK